MVYGIDQNSLNCDKLFNLMCLYGNCERVCFSVGFFGVVCFKLSYDFATAFPLSR